MKRMWHLRDTHGMSAGVYTQLSDVEVELNGYLTYDRAVLKFDTKRIVGIVKSLDPSRIVNDVSGWQHENVGDIVDVHRYQGPQAMNGLPGRATVVGEFGGLGYKVSGHAWAGRTLHRT